MKKLALTLTILFLTAATYAQVKDPVEWTFTAIKKAADKYEVVITAAIQKPWHLYSQDMKAGGPVPTKISFNNNPLLKKEGKTIETGKLEKINDKIFNMEVLFYSSKVVYTQLIKTKSGVKTNITGTVSFMVCDDTQCLPPTKKQFDIKLQ